MPEFIDDASLPDGFSYPAEFWHVVELALIDLEPWHLLHGKLLRHRYQGMADRYDGKEYVPFAARQDNDDVACWIGSDNKQVVIVHDFASPGFETRKRFPKFYSWFRQAIEDLIEFDELS